MVFRHFKNPSATAGADSAYSDRIYYHYSDDFYLGKAISFTNPHHYCNSHRFADHHADKNSNINPDLDSYYNLHFHSRTHANPNSHINSNSHAYCYSHGHSGTIPYAVDDSNTHSYVKSLVVYKLIPHGKILLL